jgi:DNA-binding GntR family transcriptional regulator
MNAQMRYVDDLMNAERIAWLRDQIERCRRLADAVDGEPREALLRLSREFESELAQRLGA